MALNELRVNKLRTFLSLFGISIGIFCVITIFAAVDSLQNNLQTSINKLGDNVIYVSQMPWGPEEGETEYQFFKYLKRPKPSYEELKMIETSSNQASAAAIVMWLGGKTAKFGSRSMDNITVCTPSYDYDKVQNLQLAEGRYFTYGESSGGSQDIIIGKDLADNLFPAGVDPLGQVVEVMNDRFNVIGVFQKDGQSIINMSNDNLVMIPFNYIKTKLDLTKGFYDLNIIVKARNGVSLEALEEELRGLMRADRRLSPKAENNFALNKLSIVSNQIDAVFKVVNIAGGIIGIFAILVGGFGIANIMFVSVRERTNLIGIKKALGAKRLMILLEFLIESMILSVIGGLIGLLFVYLITLAASGALHFSIILSVKNITIGVTISAVIGIIAGFFPAYIASRMDPVVAIRFK